MVLFRQVFTSWSYNLDHFLLRKAPIPLGPSAPHDACKPDGPHALGRPTRARVRTGCVQTHLDSSYSIWERHLGVPHPWITYAFPAWLLGTMNIDAKIDTSAVKRGLGGCLVSGSPQQTPRSKCRGPSEQGSAAIYGTAARPTSGEHR